jgi:hypothetical protein
MRYIFILIGLLCTVYTTAQKQVQLLKPARLGIFKNGTCFVKREGMVKVTEKSFFINAPDKVLMGSYWVFVGKESSISSIVVKADTFKVRNKPKYLMDFIETSIGQQVILYRNWDNTQKLTGKLLEFDRNSKMLKVETAAGKVVIAPSEVFEWLEVSGNPTSLVTSDSIIAVAKVKLNKDADLLPASTLSLERGVQWFPSYLFTIVNEKVAKLEMKATIANGETEFRNMPVDIIIGNPEMFYGKALDPVCFDYLKESILENRYDNNMFSNSLTMNYSVQATSSSAASTEYSWNDEDNQTDKEGAKNEDLYYYQLGVIDLEKNSRVLVPVMSTNVTYSEIYTANLPLNSTVLEGTNSIQTYHSYLINNGTNAPFTTGAVIVFNQENQPMAQAQMVYTPVKGNSEMKLSKAVDVQVKNEEEETHREKSNIKKSNTNSYEKITTDGVITLSNFKDKKITMRVTKRIEGVYVRSDNNGKSRKIKGTISDDEIVSELYWEIEVPAGSKLTLKYQYYTLE